MSKAEHAILGETYFNRSSEGGEAMSFLGLLCDKLRNRARAVRRDGRTDDATDTAKKPPIEAKGDCTVCKGWIDDGCGGCCIFAADYWQPDCPYDKAVKR